VVTLRRPGAGWRVARFAGIQSGRLRGGPFNAGMKR